MPSGHDLKEGKYAERNISEDELWSAFSYLFSNQSKNSTSYKYGFLKAIIDNLYNMNDEQMLTFDQLFSKFAEAYWILKYGIRQQPATKGKTATALERVLYMAVQKYNIASSIPFESLTDEMKIYVCTNVKRKCKENVVGALYADLKGLFYAFSKKRNGLKLVHICISSYVSIN